MQRGGGPNAYDRILCTRLGAAAGRAIIDKDFGNMIAMIDGETKRVPLEECAGKLKGVDPECSMVKEIRDLGISFGD
jgi:6-phosphofructokinase 1